MCIYPKHLENIDRDSVKKIYRDLQKGSTIFYPAIAFVLKTILAKKNQQFSINILVTHTICLCALNRMFLDAAGII